MTTMVCESMLANVIAFEEAGVPRDELKQAVGRDGRTIVGRGIVFQIPIARRLSEEDGGSLFKGYSKFAADYNVGSLDKEHLDSITAQNYVDAKVGMVRRTLEERS